MKKVIFLYIITLILSSIGLMAQKSNYKVFPFKAGIIEYKLEGNSKGSHIKYIDDYGYKQADYTKTVTKVFGMSSEDNNGVILIGSRVYTIDYKSNSATESKNPVYDTYANSEDANYDELGKQAMASLGFSNTGNTEMILGKKCEIWEGSLGEIWIWKGLALKSKTNVLGISITEIATKINLTSSVDASHFELPKGAKVQEVEVPSGMETMYGDDDMQMSTDDKKAMQDVANMSYEDYRRMVKKEDPEMSDEEIKQSYDMIKQMSKYMK
jgi:hypothetical protein